MEKVFEYWQYRAMVTYQQTGQGRPIVAFWVLNFRLRILGLEICKALKIPEIVDWLSSKLN